MTGSARPAARAPRRGGPARAPVGRGAVSPGSPRPLLLTGALAAAVAGGVGLAVITPLVLVGWIAAPHAGLGLPGVLRAAGGIWLAAHHVGFALRGAGRIGMLPLGLVLIPGALLWRAGRWVVRSSGLTRLRQVGYAALALAAPYAVIAGALALASRSRLASPSAPQAVAAAFLLAFCAGGLGGARALARWGVLARLLPPRARSVVAGTAGSLTLLTVTGAVMVGASLAAHFHDFLYLNGALGAGAVGSVLLLLAQLAYVPNAVGWAVCFTLGPGFAFGTGTVVAPTGVALGPLPEFPLLAALPTSAQGAVPGWAGAVVLLAPYLAGVFGGLLLVRAGPPTPVEAAPMWGFVCGAATGCVVGVLAAFSGGPLGSGHLAAVGPSAWQAGVVAALEVGVAAAVAAGAANWLQVRRNPALAALVSPAGVDGGRPAGGRRGAAEPGPDGDPHHLYLDPWAGDEAGEDDDPQGPPVSPSALP